MNLEKGKRYLLQEKEDNYSISEIEVIEISEKAYKLKHEKGYTEWILKDNSRYVYDIIEELKNKEE